MKQRVFWLLALVWAMLSGAALALDPVSFKELSLFLRMGEKPDFILHAVQQRQLLRPLTEQQVAVLKAEGGTDALLRELQRPERVAPPEVAEAVEQRLAARTAATPAATPLEQPIGPPRPATVPSRTAPPVPATPFGRFKRRMSQQLETLWTLKRANLPKTGGTSSVRVTFQVHADGKVTDITATETGGDHAHAELCRSLLREAKFDPLPPDAAPLLPNGALEMTFTFTLYGE